MLRPTHVANATSDVGLASGERKLVKLGGFKRIPVKPRLDVAKLGPKLHAKLGGSVTGYAWQLRQHGKAIAGGLWEWSQTAADAGQGWTHDTRMHIASVSKLITAFATANALRVHGKNVDDPIVDYLPDYWSRGSMVSSITFRHLLTHTAGFRTGGSASDYALMKSKVAKGVASTYGSYDYENMNFGLCRILIPVLDGRMDPADDYGSINDAVWDSLATTRFLEYCHHHVFHPSGVKNVSFTPFGKHALAYRFPHDGVDGWDSEDLTTASGGAGFRLSVNEVLDVMGTFRRAKTIFPPSEVKGFLDSMLGIDQRIETPAGFIYNKNGAWGDKDPKVDPNARIEQAVAYFLPQDMELVVFVNSMLSGNESLRGAVTESYLASLI